MTTFPPLSEEATQVLGELRRMAGASGRLRTSSCLPKLPGALGWPRIAVDEAIRDLYRAKLLTYQADGRELPVSGFIQVALASVALAPQEAAWRSALATAGIKDAVAEALSGMASELEGVSQEDLAVLARGLQRLGIAPIPMDDAGFNVSARCLMGGSKVLSMMSARMLEALGLPARLRNPSPRYVVCAGPPAPVATLLIENPRAFENAVRSGLAQDVALVCTYGFGLSYLGQDWLHQSDTPAHDRPQQVVRDGSPPSLDALLNIGQVFLWADLDLAAVSIYGALKRAVPQLQWSGIYEAMLPMVDDPALSHPYADIFDKGGQAKGQAAVAPVSPDPVSSYLWQACQTRAVDQETVPDPVIRSLGAQPFSV